MPRKSEDRKHLMLPCECGCCALGFYVDDEFVYIEVYESYRATKRHSYLKRLWSALLNKQFSIIDLLMVHNDWLDFSTKVLDAIKEELNKCE